MWLSDRRKKKSILCFYLSKILKCKTVTRLNWWRRGTTQLSLKIQWRELQCTFLKYFAYIDGSGIFVGELRPLDHESVRHIVQQPPGQRQRLHATEALHEDDHRAIDAQQSEQEGGETYGDTCACRTAADGYMCPVTVGWDITIRLHCLRPQWWSSRIPGPLHMISWGR